MFAKFAQSLVHRCILNQIACSALRNRLSHLKQDPRGMRLHQKSSRPRMEMCVASSWMCWASFDQFDTMIWRLDKCTVMLPKAGTRVPVETITDCMRLSIRVGTDVVILHELPWSHSHSNEQLCMRAGRAGRWLHFMQTYKPKVWKSLDESFIIPSWKLHLIKASPNSLESFTSDIFRPPRPSMRIRAFGQGWRTHYDHAPAGHQEDPRSSNDAVIISVTQWCNTVM